MLSMGSFAQSITPKEDPKKGSWGYVDGSDKWVVKPKYSKAESFRKLANGKEAALVTEKEKMGYIGMDGKPLGAGISFASIDSISPSAAIVAVGDKYGIVDWGMNYLVKPEMTSIRSLESGTYLLEKKDKVGVADANGNILLPVEYSSVAVLAPGYYAFTQGNKKGLYSVADRAVLVKPEYADVNAPLVAEGGTLVPVKDSKDKWGILDRAGNVSVPLKYSSITPFAELKAMLLNLPNGGQEIYFPAQKVSMGVKFDQVKNVGPFTLISGTLSKPSDPSGLRLYSELSKDGKLTRVVNSSGALISDWAVPTVTPVNDSYLVAIDSKRSSLYDKDGQFIAADLQGNPKKDGNWLFFENVAISPDLKKYDFKEDHDMLLMTEVGATPKKWRVFSNGSLWEQLYDDVHSFMQALYPGLYMTENDGKYGAIYEDKEILAPISFSKPSVLGSIVLQYTQGEDTDYAIMDFKGNIIAEHAKGPFSFPYSNYGTMQMGDEGIGLFHYDEKEAKLIELTPQIYSEILPISDTDCFWVSKDGAWGVINIDGTVVVPVKYGQEDLELKDNWIFAAKTGNKVTYYNQDGTINPGKREIQVTNEYLEHNVYNNGVKGLKVNYEFIANFLNKDGEEIFVEAQVYHKNGQPAKNSRGELIKVSSWKRPDYISCRFSDNWFFFPNANFVQGKGKQDYYVLLKFHDEDNRPLPTTGNNKLDFYLTR